MKSWKHKSLIHPPLTINTNFRGKKIKEGQFKAFGLKSSHHHYHHQHFIRTIFITAFFFFYTLAIVSS